MNIIRTTSLKIFKCKKCQHIWASRNPKPNYCACCKTPDWNKKRIFKKIRKDCSYANKLK